jgi:hypothetical protein
VQYRRQSNFSLRSSAGRLVSRWTRIVAAVTAAAERLGVHGVEPGVVNEKVYTVSLAFFAIVSWLTVLWCDDGQPIADKLLVMIAYLIGLSYEPSAGLLVGPPSRSP